MQLVMLQASDASEHYCVQNQCYPFALQMDTLQRTAAFAGYGLHILEIVNALYRAH